MDNIEEIIDADVRDKAVEDMAAYKVGDIVWVIPEKRFGIVEDRSLAKISKALLFLLTLLSLLILSKKNLLLFLLTFVKYEVANKILD